MSEREKETEREKERERKRLFYLQRKYRMGADQLSGMGGRRHVRVGEALTKSTKSRASAGGAIATAEEEKKGDDDRRGQALTLQQRSV